MKGRIGLVAAVARDPKLLRVQLAFLGFRMTECSTWIAVLVYAYDHGGAPMAGIVAFALLVPAGLVAPFGAFAGDRYRRDRVLVAAYVVQALSVGATAAALYATAPALAVYAAATAASVCFTFTRPAHFALLPGITGSPEDLAASNAVSGLAEGIGIFVGPLVAGLLLGAAGPAAVFAFFATVALLSALLVAGLRVERAADAPREPIGARGIVAGALGGFGVLRHAREPRLLVLVLASAQVVVGALDILFVATAIDLLHEGQGWVGFLNAAYGVGAIAGSAAAVALVGRRRITPTLAGGAALYGGPIAAVGVAPAAATAPVLFGVSGGGRIVAVVAGNTLLQRVAPDEVRSRVFGILEGLAMLALAIGSIGASALVGAIGIRAALVASGAFVPLVVAAAWIPLRSIDRATRAPDAEALALIRRLPIFAPLPAPAIERVMAALVRLEVPVGAVLIREGDPGDRFYVIVAGDAAVTRGGVHLVDRHAGEYVGEIALLRDVPRTATVTAITPLRLLALDREPFLEAVTGQPQARERAEAVAAERMQG